MFEKNIFIYFTFFKGLFYLIYLDFCMKKKIVLINIIFLTSLIGFGQHDPHYSLNHLNHMTINPGYAGSQEAIEVNGLFRQQWMGFEGAPNTQVFNVNSPFKLFGKNHGAGLVLINDAIGFSSDVGINLSYAYRQSVGQGTLGTGIGFGFINKTLDADWVYPTTTESDPSIPVGGEDKPMVFNLNAGIFYQADNLYLGFSATNLTNPSIKYATYTDDQDSKHPFIKRHFYLSAGYNYQLMNPLFEIQPSLHVMSDGTSTQFNLGGILKYNKRYWGGLNYRTIDALSVLFGMEFLNGIKFALAYDLTTSKMSNSSSGSLEFMLGYSFSIDIDKDKRMYKSIRFL